MFSGEAALLGILGISPNECTLPECGEHGGERVLARYEVLDMGAPTLPSSRPLQSRNLTSRSR
jgi:hypothetical protein